MLAQVYALKRLVRGLGSGHDAARQGFGLALSAALVKVPEIESLPALDMLDAALEVSKSTKVSRPPGESSSTLEQLQVRSYLIETEPSGHSSLNTCRNPNTLFRDFFQHIGVVWLIER